MSSFEENIELNNVLNKTAAHLTLDDLLSSVPNQTIGDNLVIAWSKINSPKYKKILVSVSGGSDSDILMDICTKCDIDHKCIYVFMDTGLEMKATKAHLTYLEAKYGVPIIRERAIKSIPLSCKEYGIPFLSKRVSEYIYRLDAHDFKYEDKDIDTLREEYCDKATGVVLEELERRRKATGEEYIRPWAYRNGSWYTGCISSLEWWCNCSIRGGENSQCNINHNKYLKEFLIANPPAKFGIKIANKCCEYAKKKVAHQILEQGDFNLSISGVRKSEGGIRSTAYSSCFSCSSDKDNDDGIDTYRPLFWYKNEDKFSYNKTYEIKNSDAYTVYGLPRTGCSGCPYSPNLTNELNALKTYEPNLYKACMHVFGKSYEYRKLYNEFVREIDKQKKIKAGYYQMSLWDFVNKSA